MQLAVIITSASLLLLGAFIVFRIAVRRDYQRRDMHEYLSKHCIFNICF